MNSKHRQLTLMRLASLVLVLAIAAAFMPLNATISRAEEGGTENGTGAEELEVLQEGSTDELSGEIDAVADDVIIDGDDPALAQDEAEAAAPEIAAPEETTAASDAVDATMGQEDMALSDLFAAWNAAGEVRANTTVRHNVSIKQSGSIVTVSGSIPDPYVLYGLIVDETVITNQVFGSSISQTIDMNAFSTGYHTVVLGVGTRDSAGRLQYADYITGYYMVTNKITDQPTYNGRFEVYSTYFNYYPFNIGWANRAGKLYMEYSSDGGKTWSRSGYMTAGGIKLATEEGFEISGLKAKTKYKTRIRYGEYVTYSTKYEGDGKSYFFGGPVLNTTTIRTGAATRPAVKSLTVKATKIKYHKNKVPGHYEWAGTSLIWIGSFTEKYYTCNLKVTVKLKRKPGTRGMWITLHDGFGQTKWVAGNKTTYTATFKPYPNYFAKKPRGRYKYAITLRTGQSKNWGGYSPAYKRTKKLAK